MILVIHVSANGIVAGAVWKKRKVKENEKKGGIYTRRDQQFSTGRSDRY